MKFSKWMEFGLRLGVFVTAAGSLWKFPQSEPYVGILLLALVYNETRRTTNRLDDHMKNHP